MDDIVGTRITSLSMLLGSALLCYIMRNRNGGAGVSIATDDQNDSKTNEGSTLDHLIGNTPLIKLETLSRVIGCEIFVKVRFAMVLSPTAL